MKNSRFAFIRGITVLVVVALAVCSPLLTPPTRTGARADIIVPVQPGYVTPFAGPHREVRIEQLLNMDGSNRFDLDIALLLRRERERQNETANETGAIYQEVASVPRVSKGGELQ